MMPLRFSLPSLFLSLALLALTACSRPDANAPAAPRGGDFVLQSADGKVDSRALRGNVLLIFFGYTHCPDVCPASMANGARALNLLSEAERARTRLVMISVDPERDTPARLKEYATYFHPAMVGATGTPAEIAAVAKAFGAGYQRQPPREGGAYAVDHSADTYVVAPDGRLAATLHFGEAHEKIAAAVRELL
jgi:protein SCO1/2